MTQPIFGQHSFAETPTPNAQDAFDLITGEVLQSKVAEEPPQGSVTIHPDERAATIDGKRIDLPLEDAVEAAQTLVRVLNASNYVATSAGAVVTFSRPKKQFLTDENVQSVADRIHSSAGTQAQKEAAVAAYAGKWIIVAFNLGDHRSRFGMEIVTAQQPWEKEPQVAGRVATPTRYGLTAIFDTEPWSEKIASMPIGTRVTCMGQIDQINAAEIRLRNCELVG